MAVIPLILLYFTRKDRKFLIRISSVMSVGLLLYFLVRLGILGGITGNIQKEPLLNVLLLASGPAEYYASTCWILAKYICLLMVPYPLNYSYSVSQVPIVNFNNPTVLLALGGLAVVVSYLFFAIKKRTLASFAILYFSITYSVVSNVFVTAGVALNFVAAFERAVARGVEVRILVDGVGQIYSWPPIVRALRAAGISHARFMYSLWPWRMPYLNLRNHQKILVIDGAIGFTGGMNISAANRTDAPLRRLVRDIHFKVEGPLVAHLTEAFADDWHITTKESLVGESWFPPLAGNGDVVARGIPSGPHESIDRVRWIIAAAIAEARRSLRIMTPYFLPDETLAAGLRLAALRGVEVDIIIPEKTNLAFVTWAAMARLDELIGVGCRVWLGPPPFNHSKLMLVDDCWALVGSSNWDPRSLILNFEFNVECQGADLVRQLGGVFEVELSQTRRLTLDDLENRNLVVKLRDGIARLFSPYL